MQRSLKFESIITYKNDTPTFYRFISFIFLLLMYFAYLFFSNLTANIFLSIIWIIIELILIFNVIAFSLHPSGIKILKIPNIEKNPIHKQISLKWSRKISLPSGIKLRRLIIQGSDVYFIATEFEANGFLKEIMIFYMRDNDSETIQHILSLQNNYYRIIENTDRGFMFIPANYLNQTRITSDGYITYIFEGEMKWNYQMVQLSSYLPQNPTIAHLISNNRRTFLYLSTIGSEVFLDFNDNLNTVNREFILKEYNILLPTKFMNSPIRGSYLDNNKLWIEFDGDYQSETFKNSGLKSTSFLLSEKGEFKQLNQGTFRLIADRLILFEKKITDIRLFTFPSSNDASSRKLEIIKDNQKLLEFESYNQASISYSRDHNLIAQGIVNYSFLMTLFPYYLFKKLRLQRFILLDMDSFDMTEFPIYIHRDCFDSKWMGSNLYIINKDKIELYSIE